MSGAFEEFEVRVSFSGVVKVMVPKGTRNARVMAECFALSRVVASVENPDAPDEQALDSYLGSIPSDVPGDEIQAGKAWDGCIAASVGGKWQVD